MMSRTMKDNLSIAIRNMDERDQPAQSKRDISSTIISFQFASGNNWHMQLKKDATERELLGIFKDLTKLIEKGIGGVNCSHPRNRMNVDSMGIETCGKCGKYWD